MHYSGLYAPPLYHYVPNILSCPATSTEYERWFNSAKKLVMPEKDWFRISSRPVSAKRRGGGKISISSMRLRATASSTVAR